MKYNSGQKLINIFIKRNTEKNLSLTGIFTLKTKNGLELIYFPGHSLFCASIMRRAKQAKQSVLTLIVLIFLVVFVVFLIIVTIFLVSVLFVVFFHDFTSYTL